MDLGECFMWSLCSSFATCNPLGGSANELTLSADGSEADEEAAVDESAKKRKSISHEEVADFFARDL